MIKRILIGIDDTRYAENAAGYGFNLAHTFNAHVGLVNILEPVAIPLAGNGAEEILGTPIQSVGVNDMDMLEVQTAMSESLVTRTQKKYAGDLQVTHFNEYGSTGEGIIDCSKAFNADLIVIGTHPRTGLDRLFTGSVAEYVIQHSQIPVLVVPLGEEPHLNPPR